MRRTTRRAIRSDTYGPHADGITVMRRLGWLIALAGLALVMVVCTFGFFATFEPPDWPVLRVAYAAAALAAFGFGIWIATARLKR